MLYAVRQSSILNVSYLVRLCESAKYFRQLRPAQLITNSLHLTGLQANNLSTWIASLDTSLCTHCVVTLSVLVVCVFQRPSTKRARPRVVLSSCSSHEGVPAAKSTPCFSFHLAPPVTKCATIQVDNNLSNDLPLPLSLLTSAPVYSLCALQPRALKQISSFFPPVLIHQTQHTFYHQHSHNHVQPLHFNPKLSTYFHYTPHHPRHHGSPQEHQVCFHPGAGRRLGDCQSAHWPQDPRHGCR